MNKAEKSKIQRELKKMMLADWKENDHARKTGSWDAWTTLVRLNAARLKALVRKYGWLTISKVGEQASHNAWFIVQHADHDPHFQEKVFRLMQKATTQNPNDILKKNFAFLEDRILINKKRKQTFGTQFYLNRQGRFVPRPIRDIKHLDQRREEYDLPPFSDYLASAKKHPANRNLKSK